MPRNIFKWPCVMTSRGGVREVARSGAMLELRAEDKMSAGQSGGWEGGVCQAEEMKGTEGVGGRGPRRLWRGRRGSGQAATEATIATEVI